MQRGVQVTQAFRNEIGKAVKTKRLTTGRTQKAFALEVGTTATTLRNIEMGLSLVSPPLLKRVVEATGLPFNPQGVEAKTCYTDDRVIIGSAYVASGIQSYFDAQDRL